MTSYEDLDFDQSIRDVLGVGGIFAGRRFDTRTGPVVASSPLGFVKATRSSPRRRAPVIPYRGYGMNAGIADGANLAWMMAAVLNGHADEALLSAHEAERHPSPNRFPGWR